MLSLQVYATDHSTKPLRRSLPKNPAAIPVNPMSLAGRTVQYRAIQQQACLRSITIRPDRPHGTLMPPQPPTPPADAIFTTGADAVQGKVQPTSGRVLVH